MVARRAALNVGFRNLLAPDKFLPPRRLSRVKSMARPAVSMSIFRLLARPVSSAAVGVAAAAITSLSSLSTILLHSRMPPSQPVPDS